MQKQISPASGKKSIYKHEPQNLAMMLLMNIIRHFGEYKFKKGF